MDNNKPATVLRDGSLKATIWENQGEKGSYFTATLAKTYEDKDGKLRDTHSFSGPDLLRVSELARQAYARSSDFRRELRQDRSRNTEEGDASREAYDNRRGNNSADHADHARDEPKRSSDHDR